MYVLKTTVHFFILVVFLQIFGMNGQEEDETEPTVTEESMTEGSDSMTEPMDQGTEAVMTTTELPWNPCEDIKHSVDFTFTCCDGKKQINGINYTGVWDNCFKPPPIEVEVNETISDTFWRIYNCFLSPDSSTKSEEAWSLLNFTDMMTGKFDDEYKKEIVGYASTATKEGAPYHESVTRTLGEIRAAYYYIEKAVCEKIPTDNVNLEEVKMTCESGTDLDRESEHQNGDCCQSSPIPIPLHFLRRRPTEELQACTQELVNSTVTNYADSGAQQVCLMTCIFKELHLIRDDRIRYWKDLPNDDVVMEIVKIFSNNTKDDTYIGQYDASVNLTSAVRNSSFFYDINDIFAAEFYGKHLFEVEPTLARCEVYNEITREIERKLMKQCYTNFYNYKRDETSP